MDRATPALSRLRSAALRLSVDAHTLRILAWTAPNHLTIGRVAVAGHLAIVRKVSFWQVEALEACDINIGLTRKPSSVHPV